MTLSLPLIATLLFPSAPPWSYEEQARVAIEAFWNAGDAADRVRRREELADLHCLILANLRAGERGNDIVFASIWTAIEVRDDHSTARLHDVLPFARVNGNRRYVAWVLYHLSLRLIEDGHFGRAFEVLSPYAGDRHAPEFDAWLCLIYADVLQHLGRLDEVERWLDAALESLDGAVYPADLRCQVAAQRAQLLFDLGLAELARPQLARAEALLTGECDASSRRTLQRVTTNLQLASHDHAAVRPPTADLNPGSNARGAAFIRYAIARTALAEQAGAAHRGQLLTEAEQALEDAFACDELWPLERIRSELQAARIALMRGDREAAANHLKRSEQLGVFEEQETVDPIAQLTTLYWCLVGWRAVMPEALPSERVEALSGVQAAFERQLREWQSLPRRAGGVGFLHFNERRLFLDVLIELLLAVDPDARGVEEALSVLLQTQAFGTLSRALDPGDVSVPDVRRALLDKERGALVYLPSSRRTWLFLVDGVTIQAHRLDDQPTQTLLPRCRDLIEALNDPLDPSGIDRVDDAGTSLAAALIPERLRPSMSRWQELMFVGLDLLGWVPIECVPWGDGRLGDQLAVAHVGSLPTALALIRRAEHGRSLGPFPAPPLGEADIVCLATPDVGPPDVAVRWSEDAQRPLRAAGGDRLLMLTGRSATPDRLRAATTERIRVLHLLAHGALDLSRERPSGLVLASGQEPGWTHWWPEQIAAPQPPLVILSACGSLTSPDRRGDDGAAHLGGAFLLAGSGAVLLSWLDLDLDASVSLTSAVLRGLIDGGLCPAEALRRARAEVASVERWNHPWFHSTVQAFGWPYAPLYAPPEATRRPPPQATSTWRIRSAILALVVCLCAAGFAATSKYRRGRCY